MNWLKIGKGVCQGCILSLCLFNLYQSVSGKMLGWMKLKLESRLLGEISTTSDINATLMAESERGKTEPLDEGERCLKLA